MLTVRTASNPRNFKAATKIKVCHVSEEIPLRQGDEWAKRFRNSNAHTAGGLLQERGVHSIDRIALVAGTVVVTRPPPLPLQPTPCGAPQQLPPTAPDLDGIFDALCRHDLSFDMVCERYVAAVKRNKTKPPAVVPSGTTGCDRSVRNDSFTLAPQRESPAPVQLERQETCGRTHGGYRPSGHVVPLLELPSRETAPPAPPPPAPEPTPLPLVSPVPVLEKSIRTCNTGDLLQRASSYVKAEEHTGHILTVHCDNDVKTPHTIYAVVDSSCEAQPRNTGCAEREGRPLNEAEELLRKSHDMLRHLFEVSKKLTATPSLLNFTPAAGARLTESLQCGRTQPIGAPEERSAPEELIVPKQRSAPTVTSIPVIVGVDGVAEKHLKATFAALTAYCTHNGTPIAVDEVPLRRVREGTSTPALLLHCGGVTRNVPVSSGNMLSVAVLLNSVGARGRTVVLTAEDVVDEELSAATFEAILAHIRRVRSLSHSTKLS